MQAPLTPAQAGALRRARELAVELAGLSAAVRAHLAELEADEEDGDPATGLEDGELRAAFGAARGSEAPRRPRWAQTLLRES